MEEGKKREQKGMDARYPKGKNRITIVIGRLS
jgi:hypothetical protein